MTPEQEAELAIARGLVEAGVPVFRAVPHVDGACGYPWCHEVVEPGRRTAEFHHPAGWQNTPVGMAGVDAWQPGDALCAVMGVACDVLDVDPRNGGRESYDMLAMAGLVPRSYGVAVTPSGGEHYIIARLHVGKATGTIAAGIDIQAGADDGTGRGFVYIAPTVRASKSGGGDDGEPVPYRWAVAPALDDMDGDDSGVELAEIVAAERGKVRQPGAAAPAAIIGPDDPFDGPDNSLTVDQAKSAYLPFFHRFRDLRTPEDSGFNAALNETAMVIGHYVPAFMSVEQATNALYEAATHNLCVDYQGEAAVRATIASGLTAGMRQPRSRRETPTEPDTEDAPDGPDGPDQLIGELLNFRALRAMPRPKPLVEGLLDLNTIVWMIGKSGTYKSFTLLDIMGHIAQGKPWQGRAVTQGICVCIVGEGAVGMTLRAAAWESVYGETDYVLVLPRPVQAKDAGAWATLVEAMRRIGPVMVALDTQARVTIGLDENDNSEMMVYVAAADAIRKATGACVVTVHHIGRTGTDARGASSIDGAQDTELRIERTADRRISIHLDKQKDASDEATIDLGLARVEMGRDPETDRDLSSLVIVSAGTLPAAPKVRDWIDNVTANQAEVAGIIEDHFPVGGTESNIERVLNERRAANGVPKMAHGSFTSAMGGLAKKGIIGKIKGTQKYLL